MNMEQSDICRFACPVEATISLIGGKWKPVIMWRLRERKVRFNRLMAEMPDISPKMLTKQLRELQRDGLVERTVYPEIPPRVEYELTPLARSLLPILVQMAEWGTAHLGDRLDIAPCRTEGHENEGAAPAPRERAAYRLPP